VLVTRARIGFRERNGAQSESRTNLFAIATRYSLRCCMLQPIKSRVLSLNLLLFGSAFAGLAQAQFQFYPPTQLVLTGTTSGDSGPSLSSDNLTLYFSPYGRPEDLGGRDIWQASRTTPTSEFDDPVNLGEPIIIAARSIRTTYRNSSRVQIF
jgi:hypothetical protein